MTSNDAIAQRAFVGAGLLSEEAHADRDTYGFGAYRPLAPGGISLIGGAPGPEQYPTGELGAAFGALFGDPERLRGHLNYSRPDGIPELRAEISRLEGGVDPDRIVVTNGGLNALSLTFAALVDPGDTVLVEDPTYPLALRILQRRGPRFEAVERTADGIDLDRLRERLEAGLAPKIFYSIPDFHNPTGASLPVEQREGLVELAEEFGFVIVSDNPYTWLRLQGEQLPDYAADSPAVVHTNTFAKTLGPGLRLGWAVVPEWLRASVLSIRASQDQHSSVPLQAAVAGLLGTPGAFDGILARAQAAYREQSRALAGALTDGVDGLRVSGEEGGIFLWAELPDQDVDLARLRVIAQDAGTDFVPGRYFRLVDSEHDRGAFRVGFSHLPAERLVEGAQRLVAVLNAR